MTDDSLSLFSVRTEYAIAREIVVFLRMALDDDPNVTVKDLLGRAREHERISARVMAAQEDLVRRYRERSS